MNNSFVKDKHTYGKKMARNGRKTVIYEEHSFRISLYYVCFDNYIDFMYWLADPYEPYALIGRWALTMVSLLQSYIIT